MDETRRKDKRKTIKTVLAELGSASNVHGISRIVSSNSVKIKLFWILLLILAFTGATVHLTVLVKTYFSYPVAELSSTRENERVEFPSVTLCNMNSINLAKLTQVLEVEPDIFSWFRFLSIADDIDSHRARLESQAAFYENFQQLATKIGYTADDFILKCTYSGQNCGPANFSLIFDSGTYFNCFTFNDGYNKDKNKLNEDKLFVTGTGVEHGLSLILATHQQDSPPGTYGLYNEKNRLQFSTGVRVDIHATGTMPSPVSHGFDVSPGFSTTVGLEALLHDRPGKPHGNCTWDSLKLYREYSNTMLSCLQICKEKLLEYTCGCRNSAITLKYKTDPEDKNMSFCAEIKNFTNWRHFDKHKKDVFLNQLECERKVLNSFVENRIDAEKCGCFPPCKEVIYRKSISTSYWPVEFYQFDLLRVLQIDKKQGLKALKEALDILNNTINKYSSLAMQGISVEYNDSDVINKILASTKIRQNLVRLNIYVDSLSVTEFKKIPTYSIYDLMADIGGTLGLWLGISFLTVMELVELKIRLALYLVSSRTADKHKLEIDDTSRA